MKGVRLKIKRQVAATKGMSVFTLKNLLSVCDKRLTVVPDRLGGLYLMNGRGHQVAYIDLVGEHIVHPNISYCQAVDCRTPFYRKTSRQVWCSPKCRIRWEMRKIRAKLKSGAS